MNTPSLFDDHADTLDVAPEETPAPTLSEYTLAMRAAYADYRETYPTRVTGFELGMQESTKAAVNKWTPQQIATVDTAIQLCRRDLEIFTADDIYVRLPEGFPVTKGLASRLNVAARRGEILATDRTRKSTRGGDHDHGQRLTIWRSL
jgi:hypothetical protein